MINDLFDTAWNILNICDPKIKVAQTYAIFDKISLSNTATEKPVSNVADNKFLDHRSPTPDGWGYCVFAEVVEGMDVVDKIKDVSTTNQGMQQDVPAEDVIIESVVIK
ncbi:peptidylprolyl isomerase [Beggiatoa alba]|nr:peptidylprolyl isomerase [Beggiatoa alba]